MMLILSGNDYKYELEGVMKLFIPATKFKHIFADRIDQDEDEYVFARVKQTKNTRRIGSCFRRLKTA